VAELSIDEAISRKLPELAVNHHRDAAIIDEPCPKCGGRVLCLYDDTAPVEFHDHFAHICLEEECEHVLHHDTFETGMGGRATVPAGICTFCKREVNMTC
jgi:hypothetical protein